MRVVFGKQLTFGFDDQDRKFSQHLVACIDRHNAEDHNILLAELATAENRPTGVSREKFLGLIADLIRDDQILLATSEKHLDKIASLAVLNQPERWLSVMAIRAPVVDPAVLAQARQAAENIFSGPVPDDQNALCRWMRRKLAAWRDETTSFQQLAQTDDYPGNTDMATVLTTAEQLLDIYDPRLFIETLNSRAERLAMLARRYEPIRSFYGRQGHVWQALVTAMADFKDNAAQLERDPRSGEMFRYLKTLSHSRHPFAADPAISESICRVSSVNRQITAQRARQAADDARRAIDGMLAEIRQGLLQAHADSHACNQLLYPLQQLRRQLNTAPTAMAVAKLAEKARDAFDSGRDQIENHGSHENPEE